MNNKRRRYWYALPSAAAGVLALSGVAWWLVSGVSIDVGPATRPAASSVIRAYRLSRITDADWFEEFESQNRAISGRPPGQRIEFFAAVLVDCHMDTHRSETFLETVGPDAPLLRKFLEQLVGSRQYSLLPTAKKEEVRLWIDTLDFEGVPGAGSS